MTDAPASSIWMRWRNSRVLLWLAFLFVHLLHAWLGIRSQAAPFNDVSTVYRGWLDEAAAAGGLPGTAFDFVYPFAASWPMLAADVLGGHSWFLEAWLLIVLLLDALALFLLTRRPKVTSMIAGWWWVGFLGLLGPVAIGRIDAITVPLVILALLALRHRPVVAGALLALGAWMKIWPAAVFAAVFTVVRRRWRVVLGGAMMTCVVVGVAFLAGGSWERLLSFITGQTGRGLQLESAAASVFLLIHALGAPGYSVGFNREIITVEIQGPGIDATAAALTPLMFVVVVILMTLALMAQRRGVPVHRTLPALGLGLVCTFIVVNKVGSPQFICWLAPVIIFGLVWDYRAFTRPALVALLIAGVTQFIYPWEYGHVMAATPTGVAALLSRNLLLAVLLVWSAWRMRPGTARVVTAGAAGRSVLGHQQA